MKLTPKKEERLRKKIKKYRSHLTAEKRRFGFFDDSSGVRYLLPAIYIQLEDYKGGLTYLRWFNKNFPDDVGYPIFLFEWALILYKVGKLKDAELKIIQTFFENSYLLDKFFGRAVKALEKYEYSNWSTVELTKYFEYSSSQEEFEDFSDWLNNVEQSESFRKTRDRFIELERQLLVEKNTDKRGKILEEIRFLQSPEGYPPN